MHWRRWSVLEKHSLCKVPVVLPRQPRTVMRAGNHCFKSKPSADIQRAELTYGITDGVLKISNAVGERAWEAACEKSIQYTTARPRGYCRELRQNSQLIQPADCAKMKKGGAKSPA